MAHRVRCFCGKEYRVTARQLNLALACKVCGRPLPLGDVVLTEEEQRGRGDEEEAEERIEGVAAGSDRCCESCVQFEKGRVYSFYAGYQEYRYWNRYLQTTIAKYSNVGKCHAYLCDKCVAKGWSFYCLWRIAAGLAPGIVLFPMALVFLIADVRLGLACLLVSTGAAGLCALYSAYYGWRLATGPHGRSDRERVAIQLTKSAYRRTCNCFWTTAEYVELCRSFGEV